MAVAAVSLEREAALVERESRADIRDWRADERERLADQSEIDAEVMISLSRYPDGTATDDGV